MTADEIIEEFEERIPIEDSSSKNITKLHTYTNTIEVHSNKGNMAHILLY